MRILAVHLARIGLLALAISIASCKPTGDGSDSGGDGPAAQVAHHSGAEPVNDFVSMAAATAEQASKSFERNTKMRERAKRLMSAAFASPNGAKVLEVSQSDSVDDAALKVMLKLAMEKIIGQVIKCDNSYFVRVQGGLETKRWANGRPYTVQSSPRLLQFKSRLVIEVSAATLAEVDHLNGIGWRGSIKVTAGGPYRVYCDNEWSKWDAWGEDGLRLRMTVEKEQTSWKVRSKEGFVCGLGLPYDLENPPLFESPGSCSDLPPR